MALARDGFVMPDGLARSLQDYLPQFRKYPASLAQFSKNGVPFAAGDLFKQPDLARSLERIAAQGPAGFYTGETAALLEKEMKAGGGIVTAQDLAGYEAKKRAALVELHRMLREGEVEKEYLAVTRGQWQGASRELRESLHKYVDAKGERRVAVHEDGKEAVTRVRVVRTSAAFSLLHVSLLTGRTHQIRVHLAHAGYPVLGDAKYGDFELNRRLEKAGVRRLFLHASRLALAHPLTREKIELKAPLPPEMKWFVDEQFGKTGTVPIF